jgi:hypothetical protein
MSKKAKTNLGKADDAYLKAMQAKNLEEARKHAAIMRLEIAKRDAGQK